jgi:hypothetical protein
MAFVLAGGSVQAQPLVLYDDFSLPLINPNKWLPGDFRQGLDSARLVLDNNLWLVTMAYADQTSDVGYSFQGTALAFSNPSSITAIQSTWTVIDADATACSTNPGAFTVAQATIQGTFFNAGTPIPGHTTNDVFGAIYLGHFPPDAPETLRVYFSVFQCLDDFCGNVTNLAGGDLGTATIGQPVPLLIQWDPPNHRFIFQHAPQPTGDALRIPYRAAPPPASPASSSRPRMP